MKNLNLLFKVIVTVLLAAMPAVLSIGPSPEWFNSMKSRSVQIQKDFLCMREVLWFESRSDNENGKRAVASVVLNRVESKRYPDSICGVVQQRYQFSYRNSLKDKTRIIDPVPKLVEKQKYKMVSDIAWEVATGTFKPVVPKSVLWYHTRKVNPDWNRRMKHVPVSGSKHVFLKGSDRG